PNGAGKTTLLQAMGFLGDLLQRDARHAAERPGGWALLRRLGAEGPVVLRLNAGDVAWEVRAWPQAFGVVVPLAGRVPVQGAPRGVQREGDTKLEIAGETIPRGGDDVFESALKLSLAARREHRQAVEPLSRVLESYRAYAYDRLSDLRERGSPAY